MPSITLINAEEAKTALEKEREIIFKEIESQNAFIIDDMNHRINKAIKQGLPFFEITKDELGSVPNTDPDVFIAYLRSKGFRIMYREDNHNIVVGFASKSN